MTNAETLEPEYVGFFNAGQKLYFWAIVVSAVVFLISGLPMWFPETFGRVAVAISYVLHDVAALVMLGGFIVHIYEGTAAQPGTFRSMTRGTVEGAGPGPITRRGIAGVTGARSASGGPAGPGASARAAAANLVGSAGISDTDFRTTA